MTLKAHQPSIKDLYYPKPTKAVKHMVRKRDNYTCQLCGSPGNCVDHIKPLKISHDSSPENLRTLCFNCNIKTRQLRRDAPTAKTYDEWQKEIEYELGKLTKSQLPMFPK